MSDKMPSYEVVHPKGWHSECVAYAWIVDYNNSQRATLWDFFEQPFSLVLSSGGQPQFLGGAGKKKNNEMDIREPTEDDFGTLEAIKEAFKKNAWETFNAIVTGKKLKKPHGPGPKPMTPEGGCSIS